MRMTISGPPGSGKTTVCRLLGERLHFEVVISGLIFRQMAKERNISLSEFGKLCEMTPENDHLLDEKMVEIARNKDDIILEGRLAAHMLSRNGISSFKVYMSADLRTRAERVAEREDMTIEEAETSIIERESCEAKRYRDYYDIDITDLNIYDLVVDTTHLSPELVVDRIVLGMEQDHV